MKHVQPEDLDRITVTRAEINGHTDSEHIVLKAGNARAHITHADDTTAFVIEDGEKQAAVLCDEDDNVSTIAYDEDDEIQLVDGSVQAPHPFPLSR